MEGAVLVKRVQGFFEEWGWFFLVVLIMVIAIVQVALHLYWWLDCDGAYVRAFIGYKCVPSLG